MFAHVTDGTIDAVQGGLPNSARRQDTGEWVMGLTDAPVELQQATGWYEVIETAEPTPAAGNTIDRSVELVAGVPTVVWTERAKTVEEQNAEAQNTNRITITDNVRDAFLRLRQIRDADPTAFGALTAAQRDTQLFNAVSDMAGHMIGLGRLVVDDTDDTD